MNKFIDNIKNIGILIGVLILFLIGPTVFRELINLTGLKNEVLVSLLSSVIVALLIGLIFYKSLVNDFNDFKKNYKDYMRFAFKCWAIGLIVMMFSNYVINFIIFKGQSIAGNEEAVRNTLLLSPVLGMISAGLVAPFSEELTFRMNFRKVFTKMLPFAFASTFVFAGLHVLTDFNSALDLLYFIPYGSLGFAFAICYYKTNNIFPSMFMHMLHNVLTFGLVIITYLGV